MKEFLQKVVAGENLNEDEITTAFDTIMGGAATPAQIGAFITALRMKGETATEITGAAASMRRHSVNVDAGGVEVVDTCGTGGDAAGTFNISTTAAFVAAGAGVPVAKHGNRAISSQCGSADVLTELGVNVDVSPEVMAGCLRDIGIGFLYAPALHPAMKHAGGPRRELGIRTIFNMLGPLTNPAGARAQVLGVYASDLTDVFAEVLRRLGSRRAFIVHGRDGLDEITVTAPTHVSELRDGEVRSFDLDPREYVGSYHDAASLRGGDATVNAPITRAVLGGEATGPQTDVVVLNAAAAIAAGGKANDLAGGVALARESIASGRAMGVLERLIQATQ